MRDVFYRLELPVRTVMGEKLACFTFVEFKYEFSFWAFSVVDP